MTGNAMRDMIISMRGGIPDQCDFCGGALTYENAVPEEAGAWACLTCWDRWEAEDKAAIAKHQEEQK